MRPSVFITQPIARSATERLRMPGPDGKVMHAELMIGDSVLMISDAMNQPPTSASLHDERAARMAGFNLYEISDDGEIGPIEAHVFDPASGGFRAESVPKLV